MKMSFWSHCQSLILRLQQSRTAPRPRLRRQPSWLVESLEARALLSATPAMVADINPGAASSNPSPIVAIGSTTYFTASDGVHGQELWKSNGTAAGTMMIMDINPGGADGINPSASNLTNVNGTLFFTANDGVHGQELWKSDGTLAGATMVKDINPGGVSSNANSFANVNGTIFFTADDGVHGYELWKSDGTAAGTVLLSSDARGLNDPTILNGTLFFTGDDGVQGDELWKTDGTAAGTTMVKDIFPGTRSTYYSYYGLYLNVPNSSWPRDLTNVNGTLFFTADDGIHGTELWTFPGVSAAPAPSLNVSGFPTTTTAGAAGSFTVTAKNADGNTNAGYTGTVRFTTGDPQATIIDPATGSAVALQGFTYTYTAADAGAHTFSASLKTADTQSLTATDTQTPAETATEGGILVKSAAASTMTVSGFPSTTTADVANNFTVVLKDPYGNIATGYTGTVHFTSSDAKATLPANYTFTAADAGRHTFSAALKTAGTRSITAADTLMSALKATEGGITVNAAAASKFNISAPSTVTAGVPFNLTLTVEDAYGNVVTGYNGTVHFTSTDTSATLPATYTFKAADKGVHAFVGLVLRKKGQTTITITDTHNNSLAASVTENVN